MNILKVTKVVRKENGKWKKIKPESINIDNLDKTVIVTQGRKFQFVEILKS